MISSDRVNPVRCYKDKQLFVGMHGGKCYRSLLLFDLSSLPQYLPISNVTMQLYMSEHQSEHLTDCVEVYQVVEKYDPVKVMWRHHPLIAERPLGRARLQKKGMPVTFSITALAEEWYNGEQANFGVLLKARDELSSGLTGFCSREWDDSRYWPMLEFDYVQPEKPGCEPTLDRNKQYTASNEWAYTPTLDVLVFDYTYLIINEGTNLVEACLELGMDGQHWEANTAVQLIAPRECAMMMPDTITRYARVRFRTQRPGEESKIHMFIQGRMA